MIQRVKEPSGKGSGFISGTLNLLFQKALLVPPKSKQTGQVRDLVANKSSTFFMLLPISKTKELLEIMWSSPLWDVRSNLFNIGNILPSDMKVQRIPPDCRQKQWLILRQSRDVVKYSITSTSLWRFQHSSRHRILPRIPGYVSWRPCRVLVVNHSWSSD